MIGRIVPTLLLALGVVTLGVLIMFRDTIAGSMPGALQYILGSATSQAAPEPKRPEPVAAKKGSSKTRHAARNDDVSLPDLPQRRELPVYQLDVPIPPFPTGADVKVGMNRTDVVGKFGEPDAYASWSEDGMLSEKLIYRSGKKSTEIVVRGGRVVSANSATSSANRFKWPEASVN
jgi:hypothetical protein